MTDYKQLCAELVRIADALDSGTELASNQGQAMDGYSALAAFRDVAYRARAVLARWGNHPGSPDSSTLQPVPITEHLPEPEDCNDEGEVWAWRRFSRFSLEKDIDNSDFWCLAYHKWLEGEDCGFTHWLPHWALPKPQKGGDND